MQSIRFEVKHQNKKTEARVGELQTPHGSIQTPAFVPVGTQGTVKSLTPEDLKTLGTQIFFVNTYHMYLRPGVDVVKKFGGLHKFIGWDGPLITDSGGFQVFSLGSKKKSLMVDNRNFDTPSVSLPNKQNFISRSQRRSQSEVAQNSVISRHPLAKIDDRGVTFQSHWDGGKHRFTPAKSIKIQHDLGADIILCFDDCTPYPVTRRQAEISMKRTHLWAQQSLNTHTALKKSTKSIQSLYGIVQGSTYQDLREESARFISNLPFDGIAIGGVSVGESKKEMQKVCDWVVPLLPRDKPRHLLGVGEIDDIFEIIERGIDTFDCVVPTRLARIGRVLVFSKLEQDPPAQVSQDDKLDKKTISNLSSKNKRSRHRFSLDITKKIYAKDMKPIDAKCSCYTCQNFSRAYVYHLFRVRELLAYRLATLHNLHFIHSLTAQIRESIAANSFRRLKKKWLAS